MLHDGLARAEGAGDGGRAALGDGEHGVDHALAGLQRSGGGELLAEGTTHADGPLLRHGQLALVAVLRADAGDDLVDRVVPRGGEPDEFTGEAVRYHDAVQDGFRLRDGAEHVAASDGAADGSGGREGPLLFTRQGRGLHAAGDVWPLQAHDLLERALDAVIDVADEAGAELHGQRRAGAHDLRAGAEPARLLIDLDGGAASRHIQNLSDQPLFADADDVGHVGRFQSIGHDQRAGYLDYFAHTTFPFM